MCTVTFMARKQGYGLGMNRDEKLTRPTGLPPTRKQLNGRAVLSPSEPGGGPWMALNDSGACLALINWYAITNRVGRNRVSRGEVVNAASAAASPDAAAAFLAQAPLQHINPFRLIGIFPVTTEIAEWRWDLKELVRQNHRWETQQWISSGFDEPTAQRVRGGIFLKARRQKTAGNLEWLRRLHRSHAPQAGPFSTCMHRADAATVSHTAVTVFRHEAVMRYYAGAPCRAVTCRVCRLQLRP